MPWSKSPDELTGERFASLVQKEVDNGPGMRDISRAIYRTENIIGSYFAKEEGLPDDKTTEFDPWEYMSKEEMLDKSFLDYASYADNEDELNAVRKQVARERKDRQTIADSGADGVFLGIGQSILDPINLLVAGVPIANTYKTGKSILSSGAVTAAIVGGETAAYETALHTSQLERTYGESAINLGAASLLGMAFGSGFQKLLNKQLDAGINEAISKTMDVETKVEAGRNPAIDDADPVAAAALKSVGAAQVDTDVRISGKVASFIAKNMRFDPLTRTLTSLNPVTRRIAVMLAENPYKMDGAINQAVESFATMHRQGKMAEAMQSHLTIYDNYKANGGKLKKTEWNESVSKAFRNGKSDVPEVLEAANSWRSKLYDPMKEEMIAAKLLPEDVDVKTANNYLNRVWSKEKIDANLPAFLDKVGSWLQEQDRILYNEADKARQAINDAQGEAKAALEKEYKDIIAKAEFKESRDLELEDYKRIAGDIAFKIQGSPDGRLPYDWKIGDGSANNNAIGGTSLRGPLRSRTFQIPDDMIEEFLENDIEILGARYLQNTAADVELMKTFGDVNLTAERKEIADWYRDELAKLDPIKDKKQIAKLNKQRKSDDEDIAGMRDRIRGVYGFEGDTVFTRMMRASRNLNYLRLLGGVTISSFPDLARVFMAEGFANTFKNGIVPLAKNLKNFKIAADEAKRYGVGIDALLSERGRAIADVQDYTKGGTMVERALQAGTQKFGKINILDRWTAGMKQLHAVTMQTSIFDGLQKGVYDKRLARLGISEDNAKAMWQQVKKHGGKENGVWLTNAKSWDSPDLERMWGAAVRKESDRVIIVPGQEKPLFMSREMGKSVGQFRSFMFSSTQRVFIASLQNQDHNAVGGMLMLTGMGMFSYNIKQYARGEKITDDPVALLIEGIDNSGALGIVMEVNNTFEKLSENTIGVRAAFGVSAPASRFASRSAIESILGPTYGSFLNTGAKAFSALATGEFTDSDIRAVRRLLPYQNLFYIRGGLDKIEEAIGDL